MCSLKFLYSNNFLRTSVEDRKIRSNVNFKLNGILRNFEKICQSISVKLSFSICVLCIHSNSNPMDLTKMNCLSLLHDLYE